MSQGAIDAIATITLSVLLVFILPAREWSLLTRVATLGMIVLGVPSLVCGIRLALASTPQRDSSG
jgi:hypothetical protein